jgi:hypothetical protein
MKTAWDHLPQYLRSLPEPRRGALSEGLRQLERPLEDLAHCAHAMWRGFLKREIQGGGAFEDEPAWLAWGLRELGWPSGCIRQFAPGLGPYLRRRGTRAGLQQLFDNGLGSGVVTLWERTHPGDLLGPARGDQVEPDGGPADWVTLQWLRPLSETVGCHISREDVRRVLIQEMPVGVQVFVVEEGFHESV